MWARAQAPATIRTSGWEKRYHHSSARAEESQEPHAARAKGRMLRSACRIDEEGTEARGRRAARQERDEWRAGRTLVVGLKDQLPLVIVVIILPATPILPALALVLRHGGGGWARTDSTHD